MPLRKLLYPPAESGVMPSESQNLTVLPPPGNPHWDGETGIAVWDNVPESGNGDGEIGYHWRLYKRDTPDPPSLMRTCGFWRAICGVNTAHALCLYNLKCLLPADQK